MLDEKTANEWVARLQQLWSERIPLAAAMQVEVRSLDAQGLCLAAPLAPNRNHVGTAFGGSLQGLATLAGWGTTLVTAGSTRDVGVVIAGSSMHFIAPVTGELVARAAWPSPSDADTFRAQLAARGRAALEIEVTIGGAAGAVAARFSGRFVARRAPAG